MITTVYTLKISTEEKPHVLDLCITHKYLNKNSGMQHEVTINRYAVSEQVTKLHELSFE